MSPSDRIPACLSIAGSDSGGGAGIQADLKAFARCGVHGMTAITALTAQNTVGVEMVTPVAPEMIIAQVRAVAADIGVDGVKVGMLADEATIDAVVDALDLVGDVPVVVDPVMVSASGAVLLDPNAKAALSRGIDDVRTSPEDRDRGPAAVEGAPVSRGVDAPRHPADHRQPRPGEQRAELLGHLDPVGARAPRADDGHRGGGVPAAEQALRSAPVQGLGRSVPEILEGLGIRPLAAAHPPCSGRLAAQRALRRRSPSAAPTWSAPTRSQSARSAIVRATLSTRS